MPPFIGKFKAIPLSFCFQKSKSMTKLSRSFAGPTERPTWAKHSPGSPFVNMSAVGDPKASFDASVRPSPVKPVRLTTSRTPRDLPSKFVKEQLIKHD